jgi:hypothetical protein
MISQLITSRLAVPPPPPYPIDLDLIDDNRRVGWMTRDAVGFGGFGSEAEAVYAAWVANRAMTRRSARGARVAATVDHTSIGLNRHDNSVRDGDKRIGRIVRPAQNSRSGTEDFGFELDMPLGLYEYELRAIAIGIYRALRSSGILQRAQDVRWAESRERTAIDVTPLASEDAGLAQATPVVRDDPPQPITVATVTAALGLLVMAAFLMRGSWAVLVAAVALTWLLLVRVFAMHAGWPKMARTAQQGSKETIC